MNLFAAAAALLPSDAEINTLLRGNVGDEDVSPMLRGGLFDFEKTYHKDGKTYTREYNLALYADKLFPPPPPAPPYNEEADAVHPTIEDSGLPGTSARIDAYRDWYNAQPDGTCNTTSPNEGLLDLDTEVDSFIINVLQTKGKSQLRDALFALATEIHAEALKGE